mmetsp:Transcript_7883/g.10293  ORF Transcript_7883/g.10293 Transcript_7883/m.10293 type:complete len:697 (-) Transcript_7883:1209-3299(-)
MRLFVGGIRKQSSDTKADLESRIKTLFEKLPLASKVIKVSLHEGGSPYKQDAFAYVEVVPKQGTAEADLVSQSIKVYHNSNWRKGKLRIERPKPSYTERRKQEQEINESTAISDSVEGLKSTRSQSVSSEIKEMGTLRVKRKRGRKGVVKITPGKRKRKTVFSDIDDLVNERGLSIEASEEDSMAVENGKETPSDAKKNRSSYQADTAIEKKTSKSFRLETDNSSTLSNPMGKDDGDSTSSDSVKDENSMDELPEKEVVDQQNVEVESVVSSEDSDSSADDSEQEQTPEEVNMQCQKQLANLANNEGQKTSCLMTGNEIEEITRPVDSSEDTASENSNNEALDKEILTEVELKEEKGRSMDILASVLGTKPVVQKRKEVLSFSKISRFDPLASEKAVDSDANELPPTLGNIEAKSDDENDAEEDAKKDTGNDTDSEADSDGAEGDAKNDTGNDGDGDGDSDGDSDSNGDSDSEDESDGEADVSKDPEIDVENGVAADGDIHVGRNKSKAATVKNLENIKSLSEELSETEHKNTQANISNKGSSSNSISKQESLEGSGNGISTENNEEENETGKKSLRSLFQDSMKSASASQFTLFDAITNEGVNAEDPTADNPAAENQANTGEFEEDISKPHGTEKSVLAILSKAYEVIEKRYPSDKVAAGFCRSERAREEWLETRSALTRDFRQKRKLALKHGFI